MNDQLPNDLVMEIQNNIVEHLGVKLYQNKPTNVIAELISNSWDADAENITMTIKDNVIAVTDDGNGMDFETLKSVYMVIGKSSRKDDLKAKTNKGRKITARKGLGKLAVFGISKKYDLVTLQTIGDKKYYNWLRMDYENIVNCAIDKKYKPQLIANNTNSISQEALKNDIGGLVANFMETNKISGTIIILHDLTLKKALSTPTLIVSLGKRFMFLLENRIKLTINKELVDSEKFQPKFCLRFPEKGKETFTIPGVGNVSYWVGFVEEAQWSLEEAGIGIYAHEKICQDRPFFFGIKGKEIWCRYIFGAIEADWIDEVPKNDMVGTDRTSIDWNRNDTVALYEWGQKSINDWINKFAEYKYEKQKRVLKEKITNWRNELTQMSEHEMDVIVELVKEATVTMNDSEIKKTLDITTKAWFHEPMRTLIKETWQNLATSNGSADKHIEALLKHSVPEAMSLAVTFAQRAFAINKMYELVHKGIETDLQKLISSFPWLISNDYDKLYGNQQLKTIVTENAKHLSQDIDVEESAKNRPDFVFLSQDTDKIVIIELKNPRIQLNIDNYDQLRNYISYLRKTYPKADISGQLIGSNPTAIQNSDTVIQVRAWTDVYKQVAEQNIELLAAMLQKTSGLTGKNDQRIKEISIFGGEETVKLINQLAETNENVKRTKELINNITK